MSELEGVERDLLRNPFDSDLRMRYADLLESFGDPAAALVQWQLVVQQKPQLPKPAVRLALCLRTLGRETEASQAVAQAQALPDFESVLSDLPEIDRPFFDRQVRAPLRVLAGGGKPEPRAQVISISRSSTLRFSDVVGMEDLKKTLRLRIIEPFLRPGLFERFKRRSGGGVLLFGPPGCGKTMIARAIASECKATFTAIGISEILNMWVGQSERNLAEVFEKARKDKPAVLFFDEIDALAYSRSKANSDHTRTTVNEFLSQLDATSGKNDGLLVLAATNMPWDVDEAMKRPGRFDRQVFVPPPDAAARAEMFRIKLREVPIGAVDYERLGAATEQFSGADVDGVIDAAKDLALMRAMDGSAQAQLEEQDLLEAAASASPSTSDWLKTARNLVKFGGAGKAYQDVEKYLRSSGTY
jgi:transitional endoplasmic reticulum ATPase